VGCEGGLPRGAGPSELQAEGERRSSQRVDVTNAGEVEAAVAAVAERWGRIDVLVNNAGIVKDGQLVKWKNDQQISAMSERDFRRCGRGQSEGSLPVPPAPSSPI